MENPMLRRYQQALEQNAYNPRKLEAETYTGFGNPVPKNLPEFDAMRQRVQSQWMRGNQMASDNLKRQFARMGGLGSGAYVKQQQIQDDNAARQREEALQGVDFQEAQVKRAMEDKQADRDFQGQQAMLGRNLQRDVFNEESEFKSKAFNVESTGKLAQLDLAWQQFEEEKAANEFNKRMARYQAGRSGGLLGAGGFLGTGFGAGSADF